MSTETLHARVAETPWVCEAMHEPWELGSNAQRHPLFQCQGAQRQCFLPLEALVRRYAGTGGVHDVALGIIERSLETLPRTVVHLEPGDALLLNSRRVAHRGLVPGTVLRHSVDLHRSPYREWRDGEAVDCPDSPFRASSKANGIFYARASPTLVGSA